MKDSLIPGLLWKVPICLLLILFCAYILLTGQLMERIPVFCFFGYIALFFGLAIYGDFQKYSKYKKMLSNFDRKFDKVANNLDANEVEFIAQVVEAKKVIKSQRVLEQIAIYEKWGLDSLINANSLLCSAQLLRDTNPKEALKSLQTASCLYNIDSMIMVLGAMIKYLDIEKSIPARLSLIDSEVAALKTKIQELAQMGYIIDTDNEFLDADLLLDKAKSHLKADQYDPELFIEPAEAAVKYLRMIHRRYARLEELRQENEVRRAKLNEEFASLKKTLREDIPWSMRELEQYPEHIWKRLESRLYTLERRDFWAGWTHAMLEAASYFDKCMSPRAALIYLDEVQSYFEAARKVITKPASLLSRLRKAREDSLLVLDTLTDRISEQDTYIKHDDVSDGVLDRYALAMKNYADLLMDSEGGPFIDWFTFQERLNSLIVYFDKLWHDAQNDHMDAEGWREWTEVSESLAY